MNWREIRNKILKSEEELYALICVYCGCRFDDHKFGGITGKPTGCFNNEDDIKV